MIKYATIDIVLILQYVIGNILFLPYILETLICTVLFL